MTRDEIRAEEDFAAEKGFTLCDFCAKRGTTSCKICSHFYADHYTIDPIISKVREVNNGTQV